MAKKSKLQKTPLGEETYSELRPDEKNTLISFLSALPMTCIGDKKIRSGILRINRNMAQLMLRTGFINRKLYDSSLKNYKESFNNDNWGMTGEAIKFGENNMLVDGYNRLNAFLDSDAEYFDTLVVQGILDEDLTKMDQGKTRTLSDAVKIASNKNPTLIDLKNETAVLGMIKLLNCFKNGRYSEVGSSKRVMTNTTGTLQVIEDQEKLQHAAAYGVRYYKACKLIPPALFSTLHYVMTEISEDDAVYFMDKLTFGLNLEDDSPIYSLKRRLATNKYNKDMKRGNILSQKELVLLVMTAWNKYRKGQKAKVLVIPKDIEEVGFI
jgi:hypothetical protein